MGVIVRRKGKDNAYWIFISHNGKRTSRRIGDKKAAEKVASQVRAKLQLGEFGFEDKKKPIPTFKEFAVQFMETYSVMNHKESTRENYQSVLNAHLYPAFGNKTLDEINKRDVKELIQVKMSEGLSVNTVKNIKRYLNCILNEALDDEIIQSNPASRTGKMIKKQMNPIKKLIPSRGKKKQSLRIPLKNIIKDIIPYF